MIDKNNLYVSPLLTSHSNGYTNEDLLHNKIAPDVIVNKDSGKIATYGMDNLRIAQSIRAQGSSTNEISHTVTIGDHYILEEHALKEFIARSEIENADKPIDPQMDATENLLDRMGVIAEKALADVISDTSIISQNITLTGTSKWSDYVNSAPISNIRTGIIQVRAGSGKKANTLIFAYAVWMTLLDHPDIIARGTGAAIVTADVAEKIILSMFPSIKNVWVGDAQYNSGVEGGTDTLTDIWSNVCIIAYIEPKPKKKSRTLAFTYRRKAGNVVDTLNEKQAGETWDRKGMFVRVTAEYDQKLIDEKCAYLIKNPIA
jgi:hypothetical protein